MSSSTMFLSARAGWSSSAHPSTLCAPPNEHPTKASSAAKLSFTVLPSFFTLGGSVLPPKPKPTAPAVGPGLVATPSFLAKAPKTRYAAHAKLSSTRTKFSSAPAKPPSAPAKPSSTPAKHPSAPAKHPSAHANLSSAPPARGLQIISLPDSRLPDFVSPLYAHQAHKRSSSACSATLSAPPAKRPAEAPSAAKISFTVLPFSFVVGGSVSPQNPKPSSAPPVVAHGASAWSPSFRSKVPKTHYASPAKRPSAPSKPFSASAKPSSAPPARGLQIISLLDSMLPDILTPHHSCQALKRSSSAKIACPAKHPKLPEWSVSVLPDTVSESTPLPAVGPAVELSPLFPGPKPDWVLQMEAYL
ncbi:uncharacterized protein [Eucyclogobius newberryi]|uniref:uncharacterized protein n=1 Tax=Eucyclogobius newberryi TaxID=166745 RepID=UPI003B5BD694